MERTYGAVGVELVRKGWCVIPSIGHRPSVRWREYQRRVPSELEAASWARQHPESNVALVLGHGVVALDCDATDPGAAIVIGEAANTCFGPSPLVRVGRWPRHARLYGARGIGTAQVPGVELKGRGQLLTVYGTHPKSGEPYRYGGGVELRDLRPCDLPTITRRQVREFWGALDDDDGVRQTTRRKTGLTFTDAMRGVPKGQRHAAMMTIASAARGWNWNEDEARQHAETAARRCRPPLALSEADDMVSWVYQHLPPGSASRGGVRRMGDVPAILQVAFHRALGGRPVTTGRRYDVLVDMCRDMSRFLGDKPIGLPQPAVAQILRCSQQAVSKLIRRALDEEILAIEKAGYRPGRRAKQYRFIG